MSIPTAVFLDTSILDGQQYNFGSTAFATFVPASTKRAVRLLLPAPTEEEITRHIRERSVEALSALDEARRKAPFLAKWRGMPQPAKSDWEVHIIATREWQSFLGQFSVVRLGYEGADLKRVMRWYDSTEAPFKSGRKRKEFPDAFAIDMLESYAEKENVYVAVVSADPDFKAACQRFKWLLYFPSLPRLTELYLSDADHRVAQIRTAIDGKIALLEAAVLEEVGHVGISHVDERFEVGDVDFEGAEISDHSIVALGDRDCTITFDAVVGVRVRLSWDEAWDEDGPVRERGTIADTLAFSGTAKVVLGDEGAEVTSVPVVEVDGWELQLRELPSRMGY
jgi:hypothetical protein